jgi:hypothetical protein
MEREHLIIIALILVALYMMNKDTKDTVVSMGPLGRIRYTDAPGPEVPNPFSNRIRYSDKHFAHSQHIKNHIRNRNMNSMFNGMMGTEPFRFTDGANCCSTNGNAPGCEGNC